MSDPTKLKTQQIGKCGELLVQYKLLKFGVEFAQMTTDYGIDLLAMHPTGHEAVTIQVKTARHRDRGSGSEWVVWSMPKKCIAQYVAAVDLERDKTWLLKTEDFEQLAGSGRWLWWYISGQRPKRAKSQPEEEFTSYEMDIVIPRVFGLE